MALVPFVVLKIILFPSTFSAVYSKGELEKSNPSILIAFLSPPSKGLIPSATNSSFLLKASSTVNIGNTSFALLFNAVTITDVALTYL